MPPQEHVMNEIHMSGFETSPYPYQVQSLADGHQPVHLKDDVVVRGVQIFID